MFLHLFFGVDDHSFGWPCVWPQRLKLPITSNHVVMIDYRANGWTTQWPQMKPAAPSSSLRQVFKTVSHNVFSKELHNKNVKRVSAEFGQPVSHQIAVMTKPRTTELNNHQIWSKWKGCSQNTCCLQQKMTVFWNRLVVTTLTVLSLHVSMPPSLFFFPMVVEIRFCRLTSNFDKSAFNTLFQSWPIMWRCFVARTSFIFIILTYLSTLADTWLVKPAAPHLFWFCWGFILPDLILSVSWCWLETLLTDTLTVFYILLELSRLCDSTLHSAGQYCPNNAH